MLLFLIVFPIFSARTELTKDGDLIADDFDELGFDTTGLVGYWQLNGNAKDSSGQGNHGTIIGAITATADRFATVNKAMSFPIVTGNDLGIKLGNPASLNVTTAVTISAWVNFSTTGAVGGSNGFRTIYSKGSQASRTIVWLAWTQSSGQWYLEIDNGTTYLSVLYTSTPVVGVWYFVTGTYDVLTAYAKIYINGNQVAQDRKLTLGNIAVSNLVATIGAYSEYPTAHHFFGSMDEVKIFNRALSPAEILAMYNHEKGKFSINKTNGSVSAVEFVEDPTLPVQMRSQKKGLTVRGQLIEQ